MTINAKLVGAAAAAVKRYTAECHPFIGPGPFRDQVDLFLHTWQTQRSGPTVLYAAMMQAVNALERSGKAVSVEMKSELDVLGEAADTFGALERLGGPGWIDSCAVCGVLVDAQASVSGSPAVCSEACADVIGVVGNGPNQAS